MSTSIQAIEKVHRNDLYLYFYEEALSANKTNYECDYVAQHCAIDNPLKLLDLACGHGRHARTFAQQGHTVVGIDISNEAIELARALAIKDGQNLNFIEGDLLRNTYETDFELVLFLFNSLGFFQPDDAQAIFRIIDRSLVKGGKAFIDCKNRDHLVKEIIPYSVYEKWEDMMIDRLSFDPIHGTTTNNRIYLKDGKRYEAPFMMYSYNYADLIRFLAGTRLEIKQVLGGWKNEPFDSEARRIVLVLEKI